MSNSFDFQLTAGDQASAEIIRIDEAIRKLNPQLEKTREGLKFGGQESNDALDNLSGRLTNTSRAARDNVQFIGDMVPPLKMVGEIAGKLGSVGLIGAGAAAIGGIAYAAGKLADGYRTAAKGAYDLDVHSKNSAMRVDEFTRLAGAMKIVGADSESANASVEGLFKTFNDAAAGGGNKEVLGAMSQIGAQIVKNKNGTVDVLKTVQELARVFPTLRPEMQKTVADALGLTPETLALLREGNRLKELLAKSDQIGLTVDPGFNQQMVQFNSAVNEASASWDGFKARIERKVYGSLSKLGAPDMVKGAAEMLDNNFDNISVGHFNGQNKGDDSQLMRRALRDPEFLKQLDSNEKNQLTAGVMTDQARNKYRQHYYNQDKVQQLLADVNAINRPAAPGDSTIPYDQPRNNAIGLRNKNPGNLRAAPNAIGKNGGFSRFVSEDDGISAMARQLMLYGDRGNNSLNGIIHTYAPATENKTQNYIYDVAKRTGYKPTDRLNLHDPATIVPLMAAMIRHENGTQPFSREQLGGGVSNAIFDTRWSGLRNTNILAQQRNNGPEEISGAIKAALEESPLKLEVTMTDSRGGNPQTYNVQNGGRVTYPMNN
ncbi:hypothetical protein F3J34_10530 [Klebsiella sp. Ap-873]|nr:hypothetical protein [Klebsiella sp. Ap-873]